MTTPDYVPGAVYASVWDALEDNPAEAANSRLRSELLIALTHTISGLKVTPAEAARRLNVTQLQLSDLVHRRVDTFSLEALIMLVESAGLRLTL